MNVAFFRTDFYGHVNVGGSFTHTRGFLDGLEELGHTYFAVASGDLPLRAGARMYHVPYSSLFRNLPEILSIAYNRKLLREARSILKKEKPAFLYHRHSEFNYTTSILAREFGIPLVLEFNGSEVWVKKNWGRVHLERILERAEEIQLRAADVITVVSSVIKEDLVRMGIPASKVVVNPNGVDPARFRPDIDGAAVRANYGLGGKIVAGFIGTFGAWHGVEVLARAIKPTVERNPNIHFLIIGEGALRGTIERIIAADGVGANVTLTGSIPHAAVPEHLGACDMLLSPHVQNSDGTIFFGSPTKLFEYLGMGRAVVASGIGQIGEIMHDEENCLLMRHRDHEDLAEKVLRLAADPDLRSRLGAAARKDAVEKFSWKENARRAVDAAVKVMNR
jgi:glycosyltransferase involved in cell wall biosynthesis